MRKIIIYIILIIAIIWLFIALKGECGKVSTEPIETVRVETIPQEIEEDIYNLIPKTNELSL